MKKIPLILMMSFGLASAAFAQTSGGVTMSTDPAKAAAVERHAADLKARPAPETQASASPAKHDAKHAAKAHAVHPKAKAKTAATK